MIYTISRGLLLGLVLAILSSCSTSEPLYSLDAPDADLVLRGGKVATIDEGFSIQEAVAIVGDKIVFVGSNEEIEAYIGDNTKVIKLDGKLVTPGLIDSHGHMRKSTIRPVMPRS